MAFWCIEFSLLKDPSQPSPLSMLSKLLILQDEAESIALLVSSAPKGVFNYLL